MARMAPTPACSRADCAAGAANACGGCRAALGWREGYAARGSVVRARGVGGSGLNSSRVADGAMAESSREYAALPPGLQRGGASSHEAGTSGTEPRTPSAKVALEFLVHAPSTPPAGRDGNDQLRRSLEIAAAARRWLSTRGFSEPEMAEVEALMDEFNTQALEDLGADGVRARVRELAVGTTSVVEPPHRPRPPEILIRSSETDGVVRQESCCTGSPGRGRSIRRAGSPPPTPEHVRTGMFVTLHKNEGLSSPHRRFFRFDTDTHIVAWTKQEPRRRSSYDGAGGKYAKVVCAKADIPTVRQNRGLHENVRGRCLRLQTVTHGTLNLEMEQESDVNLWLDVIREAGVTAEALDDVSPQEDAHKQLDRSPGRSKVSWKDGARDGRDSSTASILTGVSIGDDDHEAPGYSVEEDSGESLNEFLDEAHWKTARDAFHMIAKRNIDTLKSDFERIATDTVHKFLSLGPDAEISLLESLSLRSYKKGATIINQGDDGEEFFILLHGTCIVEMDSKYVRTVDAPNAFGETALVTASKRSGSVRAISDTVETAVLSKLVFDRLVRKPEYPDFWQRSSLKTKFSAAHQQRLGHTGEITGLFPQSNEVEVEFAGGEQLRFPTGALGLLPSANNQGSSEPEQDSIDPIFRYCDAPTNSETRTLGIMEDWMLRRPELRLQRIGDTRGRRVAVMRDINVARSYFQRVEEVYHIDQYALTTSTAYFGAAWTLGVILGFNWGSLMIGFLLVINSFFSERARHSRLHSEVKNHVHMNWHRSIERRSRQESPEWVNQILKVSWIQMGVEKHVSQLIKEQTNPMLEDISKGYPQVEELKLESLTLGQNPPQINNLHFENSDVFGEFRINAEARLDAPDCLAKIRVDLVKSPPFTVTIKDLNINTDFQLLVRLSSDNGLTLVGVKLRKKLGLDYAISTKLTKNLNSIGGFPVQKVLNEQIHESLWWMSDPCMLLLPWYPAANSCSPSFVAGSDMEASLFDKPVGQLQIRVKSAKNLPVGDWHAKSSDPYVQFCVEKSWPLRKFKSRMVKKNLNPIFEHVVTTSLRWNESQTGVLLFEVFDHNEVGADDRLGMAELPIKVLVKHYDGLSAQKKDISLRLRELKDAKDREASKQDPALLHLSMTYFPTYKSPRVPMAVSDQPEAGCVQGGVLQLEVVSVKNLWHDMEDLYAVITYGKELDETKTGKRDRNAWRDGAEHSNTRSAEYTPGTFTNDYYCSKTVHPADCLTDIPDDERSKHKRGHCPVKWRDMPVGFKAYHEICVENCCDGVQISIMQPNLGKVLPHTPTCSCNSSTVVMACLGSLTWFLLHLIRTNASRSFLPPQFPSCLDTCIYWRCAAFADCGRSVWCTDSECIFLVLSCRAIAA